MMTAPAFIGISNNISKAIAPPSISASEVDMLANIADPNIGRETVLRIYLLVASARHNPVTIPQMSDVMLDDNQHNGRKCYYP